MTSIIIACGHQVNDGLIRLSVDEDINSPEGMEGVYYIQKRRTRGGEMFFIFLLIYVVGTTIVS